MALEKDSGFIEGNKQGLQNLKDAAKAIPEGVVGLYKLIRNTEVEDPEGNNQCKSDENKKCSGYRDLLVKALGQELDTIFGTCYRQHCRNGASSLSEIGQCTVFESSNPFFQVNMANCVVPNIIERYGDAFMTTLKNCTLQNSADAFSKCMAGLAVITASMAATGGAVGAAAKASNVAQGVVKAADISAKTKKWLTRAVKATEEAASFTVDVLLNPLPVDPKALLKQRKSLLALLKRKDAPDDFRKQAESRIKEIDADLIAKDPSIVLNDMPQPQNKLTQNSPDEIVTPLPKTKTKPVPNDEKELLQNASGPTKSVGTEIPVEQAQAVKSIENKPSDTYVKPPIAGYEIKAGDTFESLPAEIRKHLGKVDGTNYDAKYFKENAGSVIALQYRPDGTPDFYIIGKKTYEEKYVPSTMNDFAAQNPDHHKGFLTLESAKDSDRIRVIKKPGETIMVKMSDAGYPIDKDVTINSPWGDTQTKPAGQDGYLVIEGDKTYMVNVDETGKPLGYAKKTKSPEVTKSPDNLIDPASQQVMEAANELHRLWQRSTEYKVRYKPVETKGVVVKNKGAYLEEKGIPKEFHDHYSLDDKGNLIEDITKIPYKYLAENNQLANIKGARNFLESIRKFESMNIDNGAHADQFLQDELQRIHSNWLKENPGAKSSYPAKWVDLPPNLKLMTLVPLGILFQKKLANISKHKTLGDKAIISLKKIKSAVENLETAIGISADTAELIQEKQEYLRSID